MILSSVFIFIYSIIKYLSSHKKKFLQSHCHLERLFNVIQSRPNSRSRQKTTRNRNV